MVVVWQLPSDRGKRMSGTGPRERWGARRSSVPMIQGGNFLRCLLLFLLCTAAASKRRGFARPWATSCLYFHSISRRCVLTRSSGCLAVLDQGLERGAHGRCPGLAEQLLGGADRPHFAPVQHDHPRAVAHFVD